MDQRLDQMLNEQMTGQDPFAVARQQQQMKMVGVADQELISGDAMNPLAPKPVAQQMPTQSATSLIQQPQVGNFESSGVPKILQKLGVDDKGLAFNQLGRVQLMGRLKAKFGVNFNQNSDALSALSAFDKAIGETPNDSAKALNTTVSNGERTLKALFGG